MTRPSSAAGFTLVEVAIALSVIAIGLLGLLSVITNGLDLSTTSSETQRALSAARKKVESLKTYDFDTLYEDCSADNSGDVSQPGRYFDCADEDGGGALELQSGDSHHGEVEFLSEAESIAEFGAAGDFNKDGNYDDAPAAGWTQYPVVVTVRWQNRFGDRQVRVATVLFDQAD